MSRFQKVMSNRVRMSVSAGHFFTQVYNRYPYSKRRGLSGGKHAGYL